MALKPMPETPAADKPRMGDEKSIARQVVMPFGKSLEISLKSLRARFSRSLVTVASLVLAVAFLAFTLVGNDMAMGMLRSGNQALQSLLAQAGYDLSPGAAPGSFLVTVGAKQRWIVILSLVVCAVGIINAQMMAVTERFREIGTMKCLGALDSFVLRLFMLEAGMQGLAGSAAGALAGAFFGLILGLMRFGLAALTWLSWPGVLSSLAWSVLVGLGLSLAGVAYPALVASRMPPVAAMRAEE